MSTQKQQSAKAEVVEIEIDPNDSRTNTEMERDEHLKAKYTLTGIKTFRGMDGEGLNATLRRDGNVVCTILDEGCGGEMRFYWNDQKGGQSAEESIFDEFIDAKKSMLSDVKDPKYGLSERDYFGGDSFVWKMVDDIQNDRRFKRLCKTQTLFQIGDEVGGGEYRTIKGVSTDIRAHIEKKHAGKKIYILNDKYATMAGGR